MAAVLLSGVLMRRLGNILELSEDGKKAVREDWYHILIGLALVPLYMTRSFWLSISWWLYLLTAGLGLIAFAAWNEIRKRGKE